MKAPVKKKISMVKKHVVKKPTAAVKKAKTVAPKAAAKPLPKASPSKAVSKAAPKAAKPVGKTVAKAAAKSLAKSSPAKVLAKSQGKAISKPVAKLPVKSNSKPAAKPVPKSPVKASGKAPVKTPVKVPVKAAAKLLIKAPIKSSPSKSAAKSTARPVAKSVVKPAAKLPVTPPAKPLAKTAVPTKVVAKPATKPSDKAPAAKVPVPTIPAKVATLPTAPMLNKAALATAPIVPAVKPKTGKAGFMSPSNIAPKLMEVSTAAKTNFTMSSPVLVPPPPLAVKKDAKLANNWKTKTPATLTDAEAIAMPDSEYMSALQLAFFRLKLMQLKKDILNSAGETTEHLREDTSVVPDPADRATIEEEHALELRTRDRERKLLKKIEQSIQRIDSDDYGYCDETGEPIGAARLIARPTASLSLEAQQRRELKQKMFGD